jgi:hypothetical protein
MRNIILMGAKQRLKKIFTSETVFDSCEFDILKQQKTVSIKVNNCEKTFQLEAFSDFYDTLEAAISDRVKNIEEIERLILIMDFENKKINCTLFCKLNGAKCQLPINDVF